MGVKQLAVRTLNAVGLEVRRSNRSRPRSVRCAPSTAGQVLEVAGVNGVGKSTFMRRVQPLIGGRWLSTEELHRDVDVEGLALDVDDEVSSFYEVLLTSRIENILAGEHHTKTRYKSETIYRYCKNLVSNLALDGAPLPIGVLKDEGLIDCREFAALLDAGHPGVARVLERRSLVYVTDDPTNTLERLKSRRTARGNDNIADYPDRDDARLLDLLAEREAAYRTFIEGLERLGTRTVTLHQSDGFEHNRDVFLAFERSLAENSLD